MDLRGEDLFAVAESLAELIGAPVTIEDENSTVLAYSTGEHSVDDARIDTILKRQVPGRWRQLLTEAGVFERLYRDTGVLYVDLHLPELLPRAAIAVRDGDRPIGSIWAAMDSAPTAMQESILRSAVPFVAERIAAERNRGDVTRRLQVDRVRALINGGEPASRAADALGLEGRLTVAAASTVSIGRSLPTGTLPSLTLHLGALAVDSVAAQFDDVIYLVIAASEMDVRRLAEDFLGRARSGSSLVVAVGREVNTASAAHLSKEDADKVLAALQHARVGGVVGTMGENLASVLALRAANIFDGLDAHTPLAALAGHDEQHGTDLVATARAFLSHGGDVAAAAATLHVHPNTLRNRLRRAVDSCGVDLNDADTRLILMLHLKLVELREH
ncbi:PucR family transcriptional regulator [Rhodococcus sp. WMMA185]|uniref:PucR family transcriptional regulator n=1 Tax=Rhodococcus sp. WMMA185 TaxID=679318 RepID=UPI000877FC78|nr:PucR family transcriptional regulator [Rhodococcus sp. WMMA185]AOW93270.1 PucR family transcriptional regulator [Rhodococcus sp. WMMA185]